MVFKVVNTVLIVVEKKRWSYGYEYFYYVFCCVCW